MDTPEENTNEAQANSEEPSPQQIEKRWYVVHTYSGFENKVKASLEQRIITMGLEDQISKVVVPMEKVMETYKGKKQLTSKKFYPGYIIVYMRMTDETWHLVKSTPKVTGFVGSGPKPPPLEDHEVEKILEQMETGLVKPKPKLEFAVGDKVRVAEGPFANFVGVVDEINQDKSKLKVMVSIFGRQTPVEFDFSQVEPST